MCIRDRLSGVPNDVTVECDEIGTIDEGNVSAIDNCDDNVAIDFTENTEPSADCEDSFTIIRTWTATDNCGNTAVATQTISVGDNTPPTLSGVPSDITVECDEVPGEPNAGIVNADDNCDDNVDIDFTETTEPSADCEDSFTIIRTWTATDNCGNSAIATQTISVGCLLYTSPSPRDRTRSRMPSSA